MRRRPSSLLLPPPFLRPLHSPCGPRARPKAAAARLWRSPGGAGRAFEGDFLEKKKGMKENGEGSTGEKEGETARFSEMESKREKGLSQK